jgi:hypothetical protein
LCWWYELGEKSKGVASTDRNSCKWSHVIYWHLTCSDNLSLILHLSTVRLGNFAGSR